LSTANAETHLSLDEQYILKSEYPMREIDGYLIYSRYDKTGNSKEIISLDPLTKKEEILVSGEHEAIFVAKNEEHIVYFDYRYDRSASPLLLSRVSDSKIIGKIKLHMYPHYSFLKNKELLVVEEGGGVLEPTTHAAFFTVPDLKFKKEVEIFGDGTVISINNIFVSLGRDKVYLYDDGMNLLRSDTVPKESSEYSACTPRQILKISNNRVAFTKCYDLYTYDLNTFEVKKILMMGGFYIYASDGRYMYAFPTDVNASLKAKLFRISDNKLLSEISGLANYVLVKNNKIITLNFEKNNANISIFSLN